MSASYVLTWTCQVNDGVSGDAAQRCRLAPRPRYTKDAFWQSTVTLLVRLDEIRKKTTLEASKVRGCTLARLV